MLEDTDTGQSIGSSRREYLLFEKGMDGSCLGLGTTGGSRVIEAFGRGSKWISFEVIDSSIKMGGGKIDRASIVRPRAIATQEA